MSNLLSNLVAALESRSIEPVSLHYEHVRKGAELTDPIRVRWTLYVATCDEFRNLAALWRGKRSVRQHQKDVRNLYADCGDQGLLGHCCYAGLPCWDSSDSAAEPHPAQGDLFSDFGEPA